MSETEGMQILRAGILVTVVGALLAAGCETSGKSGRYDTAEGISCQVPQRCDGYTAAHVDEMRLKLLRLYDQIEMTSGPGNAAKVIEILKQLEYMLDQCPRLVQPELLTQVERPVHELQRANLAMVLGWFPEGKDCSIPVLVRLLEDPIPLVRFHVAGALLDLKDERGLTVMMAEGLSHPNETVRTRALEALSEFAGETLASPQEAQSWYARR